MDMVLPQEPVKERSTLAQQSEHRWKWFLDIFFSAEWFILSVFKLKSVCQ